MKEKKSRKIEAYGGRGGRGGKAVINLIYFNPGFPKCYLENKRLENSCQYDTQKTMILQLKT